MEASPRPLAGLDYESCTLGDLQLFFKQRSGKELPSPERHDKRFVIRCLQLLDDSFSFRFMDLAGELRNVIYENVLLYTNQRPARVYPEILRVSKLCHTEGRGILKQELSPISLVNISGLGTGYRAHVKAFVPSNAQFHTQRLSRQLSTWYRTSVSEARVVTIDVDLKTTEKLHLNRTLYALTTILFDSSPSIVFFRATAPASQYTQKETKQLLVCLSHLAHLDKRTQLKFKGVPKAIQDRLFRISQGSKRGTPMSAWLDATVKIKEAFDLVVQVDLNRTQALAILARWERTTPWTSDSAMIDMLANGAERNGYHDIQRRLPRYLGKFASMKP